MSLFTVQGEVDVGSSVDHSSNQDVIRYQILPFRYSLQMGQSAELGEREGITHSRANINFFSKLS